jgi:MoaA/NifB/PqqE/SkfB family radical SAM enzyme
MVRVLVTIAGMMLKIVPFLVWYRVYAPRAGRHPVPTLAQLTSPAAEGTAYALVVAGIVLVAAALAAAHPAFIRAAGVVLALGAVAFAAAHRQTLRIIDCARALGLPVQINTTVCRQTLGELPALAEQVSGLGAVLWALFFLIPVGRAQAESALPAREIEHVLEWAAELQEHVSYGVKTTEAPHYHRVRAERTSDGRGMTARPPGMRASRAVTDGNGFVFIDHLGNICPSGFLPTPVGNVRGDDLVSVYRSDPLFLALRDPARLGGRRPPRSSAPRRDRPRPARSRKRLAAYFLSVRRYCTSAHRSFSDRCRHGGMGPLPVEIFQKISPSVSSWTFFDVQSAGLGLSAAAAGPSPLPLLP